MSLITMADGRSCLTWIRKADIHVELAKTGILEPQGPSPQVLTLFEGARWIAGAPFKGNANRAHGIFGAAGWVWVTALQRTHQKTALCHTRPVGGRTLRLGNFFFCFELFFFFFMLMFFFNISYLIPTDSNS